jgi:hypothetical protein
MKKPDWRWDFSAIPSRGGKLQVRVPEILTLFVPEILAA